VSKSGVPLAIRSAGANVSDHRQILPVVMLFPKVRGKKGRPKELPDVLFADGGYDSELLRAFLRWLGIEPKIPKRKSEEARPMGKICWVVERTISWLKGLRRLRVRYDPLAVMVDAWTTLAASVICFRILHHDVF